jgi:Protein of unknown function (DUF4232)
MRLVAATTAALTALAVAACGTTKTKTVTVAASTATTSAGSTTTPTTVSTSTTTSAAGPPLCVASNLSLSYLGQQGAAGHGIVGFLLKNTGGSSCHTYGFPGILWLNKSGAALPTNTVRTTHDFFGPAPLISLTIAPGGTFSFRLGVTHGAGGETGCTTAAGLQVIPPNDTHTLRITIPNGVFECRTTTVSPVRPGSSAYHP